MTDRELLEQIAHRLCTVEAGVSALLDEVAASKRASQEHNDRIREQLKRQMEQFPPELRGMLAPMVDM